MKKFVLKMKEGFQVLARTAHSEAATMCIAEGESEGGADNKHKSDQWLFVIGGSGEAIVEGKRIALAANSLLLINAGETHEIKNTGSGLFKTLNVYSAPEF